MIERYITQPKSRARFECGPMASLFPEFISELEVRRYRPESIQRMIRTADHLGRWLQGQRINLDQATQAHVDQFVLAQSRRPDKHRGHLPKTASHITTVTALLRKQGILNGPMPRTEIDEWADRYATHLIQVRGVTKFTHNKYVRYARRLVLQRFLVRLIPNTSPGKRSWRYN